MSQTSKIPGEKSKRHFNYYPDSSLESKDSQILLILNNLLHSHYHFLGLSYQYAHYGYFSYFLTGFLTASPSILPYHLPQFHQSLFSNTWNSNGSDIQHNSQTSSKCYGNPSCWSQLHRTVTYILCPIHFLIPENIALSYFLQSC